MNDFLRCENLRKSYAEGRTVLDVLKGVDIEIGRGELLGVIGPSGAGKSTLLHLLGGLDEPSAGSVFIDGKNIFKLSRNKRAQLRLKKTGFVFQFYHLLPEFNVLENVMMPLFINRRFSGKKAKEKAIALIEEVGLKERITHKPAELSGGEAQRVAVARALINEPEIVFCDEPTGNLDSETGKKILELLLRFNKEKNVTFVIVSHDDNIVRIAGRTIHIKDGLMQ
ncbi:MAG: ABC transporter ATP-binding protein [Candidatus Omnitrophota bacterium]